MSAIIDYLFERFRNEQSFLFVYVKDTPYENGTKVRVSPIGDRKIVLPSEVLTNIENIKESNYPDVSLMIAGYIKNGSYLEARYFLRDSVKREEVKRKRMALMEAKLINLQSQGMDAARSVNIFYDEGDHMITINATLSVAGIDVLSKLELAFGLRTNTSKEQ